MVIFGLWPGQTEQARVKSASLLFSKGNIMDLAFKKLTMPMSLQNSTWNYSAVDVMTMIVFRITDIIVFAYKLQIYANW